MPVIFLKTEINSTIEICFDLSRSIDLHKISTAHTNEKAIAGCTKGLIDINEFVTWEAIHFGIKQRLSTKITEFDRPLHFKDEQIKGAFKFMKHCHNFEEHEKNIIMTDVFEFQSPLGILGMIVDLFFLKKYLRKLLLTRNTIIKEYAETEKWKSVL